MASFLCIYKVLHLISLDTPFKTNQVGVGQGRGSGGTGERMGCEMRRDQGAESSLAMLKAEQAADMRTELPQQSNPIRNAAHRCVLIT